MSTIRYITQAEEGCNYIFLQGNFGISFYRNVTILGTLDILDKEDTGTDPEGFLLANTATRRDLLCADLRGMSKEQSIKSIVSRVVEAIRNP